MKLDELLSKPDPSGGPRPERLRGAVFAELDVPPARGWRGDLLLLVGACWLLVLAIATAMLVSGAVLPSHLIDRAAPILALLTVGGASAFTALAPRRRGQWGLGLAVAAVGLVGLVLVRQSQTPSGTSPWVCTLSHLAVGLAPLALGLALLRKAALHPLRAALLGLAVGTTGAAVGELACEQGWQHVALWHLGAWIGLALVAALVSRRLVPRTFAP